MGKKAIVIGVSAGGVEALKIVLNDLDEKVGVPIIIVIHSTSNTRGIANIYQRITSLDVKEAEGFESIAESGYIYFAPPGYHLSVEQDYVFSLSIEEKVNMSRPSIDVLFESAAEVYKDDLIGILLTGANNDGALGLKRIEELGGICIVQSPSEAYIDTMPKAGIEETNAAIVMELKLINEFIKKGEF